MIRRIDEQVVPGQRLGRHVHHDERSREFPAEQADAVRDVWHRASGLPLDQGQRGSCTAQAFCGALNSAPNFKGKLLTEADANTFYDQEIVLEGGNPQTDDWGGTGLLICQVGQKAGLISGYQHAFGLDQALAALTLRPVITGMNWYECLCDDQRVLTSDLRWVPIQKVRVGDELVGFDESIGMSARMRRSVVTAMGIKQRPAFEIITDQGSLAVSGGHLLVGCDPKQGQSWIRADQLSEGDRLAYYMQPYDNDRSWEAGWLAGFFDGEGTVAGDYQVNFAQAVGPTLEHAVSLLEAKGFEATPKQKRYPGVDGRGIVSVKEVHNVYVTGPYHGALRMLGQIRPARLLENCSQLWEGRATRSRRCPPATVQAIIPLGVERVHSIGTSTGTLLAEGMLSHNSFDRPDDRGVVSIAGGIRGGHEVVVDTINLERKMVGCWNSWGPGWGPWGGRFWMSFTDWDRLLGEDGDVTVPVP